MKKTLGLLICSLFFTCSLPAKWVEKKITYDSGEAIFEGVLIHADTIQEPVPAVLMVPNWMGVTEAAIQKAKELAGDDYVFFIADMYGVDVRPTNMNEAGQAAGFVRADRPLMRARAALGLETMLAQEAPIDKNSVAAIGFCFGGGTVLELGRSGADVDAIVSFHGDLVSPTLETDAANTKASILVLHGAADPFVPREDVNAFTRAMLATEVDWQLIEFSQTVHSFTDPNANMTGKAEYHELSAKRAFAYMSEFLGELFDE